MSNRPPLLSACVGGFAAWQIGLLLRERLEKRVGELERSGRVHPAYVAQLRAAYGEIVAAGELWQERVSVDGRTEAAVAEIGSSSLQREEITPEEAAEMVGVTASRVRQLLRSGVLPGRRVGGRWLLSSAAVESYVGTPRGVVA